MQAAPKATRIPIVGFSQAGMCLASGVRNAARLRRSRAAVRSQFHTEIPSAVNAR